MKTLILCGGEGQRLRPYTITIPKPLMPFRDKPIVDNIINQLIKFNINSVFISVGYLGDLVKAYFNEVSGKLGIKVDYLEEKFPLGTAGPLKLVGDSDDVLLMNGDTLTDLDYRQLTDFFYQTDSGITIATFEKNYQIDLGILHTSGDLLDSYEEKPLLNYKVSMGIYCIRRDVIAMIPKDKRIDIPELVNMCLQKDIKITTFIHHGFWFDLGRAEDFEMAIDFFAEH